MSRNWYDIPSLSSRSSIKDSLQKTNGSLSAAAAELGCTAEQLRKAMEAHAVPNPAAKQTGTELQLRLRRMLEAGNSGTGERE
ncbi:MAG TPA: hypothetical protein O0X97_05835 [Methanocorpusculum sp.]|nr:hypothetical protein [Methanocorpusculum sp.]